MKKSLDYIFGMITGIAISIAVIACTNNSLQATSSEILEVKVVNPSWDPVEVLSAWVKPSFWSESWKNRCNSPFQKRHCPWSSV